MINIRLAEKSEIADLQTLNDAVFADSIQYDSDLKSDWEDDDGGKSYFTNLVNDSESLCLIAEDEGRRVGYLAAKPAEMNHRKSKYFEIDNMGVIPEYRSHGVGKMLMEKSFEWAKEKGYQKAFVNAYFKNHAAVNFYKKFGFEEMDINLERTLE